VFDDRDRFFLLFTVARPDFRVRATFFFLFGLILLLRGWILDVSGPLHVRFSP